MGWALRRSLIVALLVSGALFSLPAPHRVEGQVESSVLYVSPLRTWTNSSFAIAVRLNLTSSEAINVYELIVRYDNTILNATGIQAGDIFEGRSTLPLSNCINGLGTGCNILDGAGVVRSATLVLGSPIPGPASAVLFYIQFSRVGVGRSLLEISNETLTNPGQNFNPHPILHVTYNGIYSNHGLAGFFNIVSPAVLAVGQTVLFDATGSFNPDNSSITGYRWEFGDGQIFPSKSPFASHTFLSPGSYNVTLTVTDVTLATVSRLVTIVSALGGIKVFIFILALNGTEFSRNVTVSLYNITGTIQVLFGSVVKSPNVKSVVFSALRAGSYRVDFGGAGIVSYSRDESVMAGWTTQDVVYLSLKAQPNPPPPPPAPDSSPLPIVLALVAAGLSLGSLSVFLRRRRLKSEGRAAQTTRKARR